MAAPARKDRQKCYDNRDLYFACSMKNAHLKDEERVKKCQKEMELFTKSCPSAWTTHFLRKHTYELEKARLDADGHFKPMTVEAMKKEMEDLARQQGGSK
eukprot:scpid39956/ scgid24640/ 